MSVESQSVNNLFKQTEPKCCTKKENCSSQPKCQQPPLTEAQKWYYFLWFNLFYTLLRLAISTKKDTDEPKKFVYFVLWIQLQLLYLYFLHYLYYFTIYIYSKVLVRIEYIKYFLLELFGTNPTDPFFAWFGLYQTYYYLYKIYCICFICINWTLLSIIVTFYLIVVALVLCIGPFLLGYYTLDLSKAI